MILTSNRFDARHQHPPICRGEKPPDAVFCGNAEYHKALGKFRYVMGGRGAGTEGSAG